MLNKQFFLVTLLSIISGAVTKAETRLYGAGGLGYANSSSAQASTLSNSRIEMPGGFSIGVDQFYYDSLFIFVEHIRSLGSSGSGIGITTIGLKKYPWLNPVLKKTMPLSLNTHSTNVYFEGYCIYYGLSLGFAQASLLAESPSDNILALGPFANAKLGVEMPLNLKFNILVESNLGSTFSATGSILNMNAIIGLIYQL